MSEKDYRWVLIACKGTKIFWDVQIMEQNFSKLNNGRWPITHLSRNAQSPQEQIVRSEAKISTVSSGADRSERSGDKKGEKKF